MLVLKKKTLVFWHQSEARTAATVRNSSGKTLSPRALLSVLYFSFVSYFPARLDFPSPHYLPLGLRGWLLIRAIPHFHIHHNAPCLPPKFCKTIVSNFSWVVPGEIDDSGWAKFWVVHKVHFGLCEICSWNAEILSSIKFTATNPWVVPDRTVIDLDQYNNNLYIKYKTANLSCEQGNEQRRWTTKQKNKNKSAQYFGLKDKPSSGIKEWRRRTFQTTPGTAY